MKFVRSGKVRDIYKFEWADDHLMIKTTDRVSAFDVVLPDTIPGKGLVLVKMSEFWMKMMDDIIPNHLTDKLVEYDQTSQIVKNLAPLSIEAIVRGYIIGSGWKDYKKTGMICDIPLPGALQLAQQLPEPIFTPSTKTDQGHDRNISFTEMVDILNDPDLADRVRDISLKIYKRAQTYAYRHGFIIADTKFEFGRDAEGNLYLIDEVLTPDSSRFWHKDEWIVGTSPPSYDKQIIRDYLETLDWNKQPPGPNLPQDIIDRTSDRYHEIAKRLGIQLK